MNRPDKRITLADMKKLVAAMENFFEDDDCIVIYDQAAADTFHELIKDMEESSTEQEPPKAKPRGPLGDRKIGERAAKGVVPPFHPKGKDHREYRS